MREATRKKVLDMVQDSPVSAVDLFCGASGLTHGLIKAGIRVEAGIDIDEQAAHAFSTNNSGVDFLCWDVARKNYPSIAKLFRPGAIRLLAGCAPCQPFSKLKKIDAVIGRKQALETEVQNLAQGRYPLSLFKELAEAGFVDESMEYWPYDGEVWPDEIQ